MENKEDIKYATVGSILEYLQNGIKTGKFTVDTPILGTEDEFFFIHQIEEPAFHQLKDADMTNKLEDYTYYLDKNIQSYEELLNDAKSIKSNIENIAYYEDRLKKAKEEKSVFESLIKQNAIVFN